LTPFKLMFSIEPMNLILLSLIAMAALAAVTIYQMPDALRRVVVRLSARIAYIEAGRQAYRQELERLGVSA